MSIEEKIKKLEQMNEAALQGGGEERIQRQHDAGKLTARERIDRLFDSGTFVEIDAFVTHRCTDFGMQDNKTLGDGVVTGYGQIAGRQDVRLFAGCHGIGWEPFGRLRGEGLQGHGPGCQRRSAGDRAQRRCGRADSGGCGFPRWLRGSLLAQRALFRRRSADFGHHGSRVREVPSTHPR